MSARDRLIAEVLSQYASKADQYRAAGGRLVSDNWRRGEQTIYLPRALIIATRREQAKLQDGHATLDTLLSTLQYQLRATGRYEGALQTVMACRNALNRVRRETK